MTEFDVVVDCLCIAAVGSEDCDEIVLIIYCWIHCTIIVLSIRMYLQGEVCR